MSVVFNYQKFYEDLNRIRKQRNNIAWNKVATRSGITRSGLSTFANYYEKPGSPKKTLALESFVKLLHWMKKTDIAEYIVEEDLYDGDVR